MKIFFYNENELGQETDSLTVDVKVNILLRPLDEQELENSKEYELLIKKYKTDFQFWNIIDED